MSKIQPFNVWVNGAMTNVTDIETVSTYDNLKNFATFTYKLLQFVPADPEIEYSLDTYVPVVTGTINMTAQDYIDWDNSNEAAIAYVADKLNVTLLPE